MKVEATSDTLQVTHLPPLTASTMRSFKEEILSAYDGPVRHIEIDLSQIEFIDSSGVGALLSLRKVAANRHGVVRLVNPKPFIRNMLEQMQIARLFELSPP